MKSKPLIFTLLTALIAIFIAGCGQTAAAPPFMIPTPGEPQMSLRAEPVPDEPRTFQFIIEITGGTDEEAYWFGCGCSDWKLGGSTGTGACALCVQWAPDREVNRQLVREHTFNSPGIYEVTHERNGQTATVSVEVPHGSKANPVPAEPQLTLRAEPVEGRPRRFRIIAEITGGDDADIFCKSHGWGLDGEITERTYPICPPADPFLAPVQRQYERSHTFGSAGEYTVVFEYDDLAASVTVKVE